MPKRTGLVLIALVATALLALSVVWYASRERLPREIRIAAGKPDGLYHSFSQHLARRLHERTGRPVHVIETNGSEANLKLLHDGDAELALIQTVSLTPDGVAGIAPLFPEPLHFIVRRSKGVRTVGDLTGRRVVLGPDGSGSRQTAQTVLNHYHVRPDDLRGTEEYFGALATDPGFDAALVTTGWMNPTLEKLLRRDDLELVAIPDPEGLAARHPWFTATTIPRGLYPGKSPVPAEAVPTVAVTALLVGHADCPDPLVRETLAAMYETDLRAVCPALLSARAARDYDAAVMHPAVARYHDPSGALERLANSLELIGKSKEAILGVVAGCLLLWGWFRRRWERAAAEADRLQRDKLEAFIGQTLEVELEQMDVADPEELRAYLRRVTHIKQAALRELTSERVRGDQLFAIFLSQCAALSEKIQMRMLYGRISEPAG